MEENPYESPKVRRRPDGRSPQEILVATCAIVGFILFSTLLALIAWGERSLEWPNVSPKRAHYRETHWRDASGTRRTEVVNEGSHFEP